MEYKKDGKNHVPDEFFVVPDQDTDFVGASESLYNVEQGEGYIREELEYIEQKSQKLEERINSLPIEKQSNLRGVLRAIQEKLMMQLSAINQFLHTDLQSGELKGAFGFETVDQYLHIKGTEFWNQPEYLKENRDKLFRAIQLKAIERGTWNKEYLEKVSQIKKDLLQLPLVHWTDEERFQVDLKDSDLMSYKSIRDNDLHQKGNTYPEDVKLGRDQYIYFSFGEVYMGNNPLSNTTKAVVLEGKKICSPVTMVQDVRFFDYLGLSSSNSEEEEYIQKLAKVSLTGSDYIQLLSTALATQVLGKEKKLHPEVMIRDRVKNEEISFYMVADDTSFKETVDNLRVASSKSRIIQPKRPSEVTVNRQFLIQLQQFSVSDYIQNKEREEHWYQYVLQNTQLNEVQAEVDQIFAETKQEIETIKQTSETVTKNVEEKQELLDIIDDDASYQDIEKVLNYKALTNEAEETYTEKPMQMEAHVLSEVFERAGIESKVVKVEGGGEFSEVIILEKKEIPTEKLIRLYRGINHIDDSVLEQIPYAMRSINGTDKPTKLESVRQEVDALAKNPTYENLIAYTDKVYSSLTPDEQRRFGEDLKRIEDEILKGYSTRTELIMSQIGHLGKWCDNGISPYISSSYTPYTAAGYGSEALMVIDVPISQIEIHGFDEASIKGVLDKKYITAILPRRRVEEKVKNQVKQELDRALQKVYENVPTDLYEGEELRAELEKKQAEQIELDKEQWKKDVENVRQKRVVNLIINFPEVKLDLQNVTEQDVDIYTKAKRDIFDFYKARLEKIGKYPLKIEDYYYKEHDYGERKNYDREEVNDTMLFKLKEHVEFLEKKEEERKTNR